MRVTGSNRRILLASALTICLITAAAAQASNTCNLTNGVIVLGDVDLVYSVDPNQVPLPLPGAAGEAGDDPFFDDGMEASAENDDCASRGMVGAIRCGVTKAIDNAQANQDGSGRPAGVSSSQQTSNTGTDPVAKAERELADSKSTVTVPVRRYLIPGNPPSVVTRAIGRPRLSENARLSQAALKRLNQSLATSLDALDTSSHPVHPDSYQRLLQGGTTLPVVVTPVGSDPLLVTGALSAPVQMPAECVSYLKSQQNALRLSAELDDVRKRCKLLSSNIDATRRANARDPWIERVGGFVQDLKGTSRLSRLQDQHAQCLARAAVIRRQLAEENAFAQRRRGRLETEQRARELAAIKNDPAALENERKARVAEAVLAEREVQKHRLKMNEGIKAYDRQLREFDRAIAELEAGNLPNKEAQIALLKRERERYQSNYDSWLEHMERVRQRRGKDANRVYSRNRSEGIGPTDVGDLRQRLAADGSDANELLEQNFDETIERAALQAVRDRRNGRPDATIDQSGPKEKLASLIEAYSAGNLYKRVEHARKVVGRSGSYVEGVGLAGLEGAKGLVSVGKGGLDLVAEIHGFDGFQGNTVDRVAGAITATEDFFSRGADGQLNRKSAFENYAEKVPLLTDAVLSRGQRATEIAAGQGEEGIRKAIKTVGQTAGAAAGVEAVAASKGLSTLKRLARSSRGLDTAGDASRVVNNAGDLGRSTDLAGDAGKGGDAAGDLTRTVEGSTGTVKGTTGGAPADDAFGKTATFDGSPEPVSLGAGSDALPVRVPKAGTKERRAYEALRDVGVEPKFARVFAGAAGETSAEQAIADALLSKWVSPKRLLREGSVTEEGLRQGLRSALDAQGITNPRRQADIMERLMALPENVSSHASSGKLPTSSAGLPDLPKLPGKSGQALDALKEAGVDPRFLRFHARQAADRTAEHAIASGLYNSRISPRKLIENGTVSEKDLRRGMKSVLDEYGIRDPQQQAGIIDRFMSGDPGPKPVEIRLPSSLGAGPEPVRVPAAAIKALTPDGPRRAKARPAQDATSATPNPTGVTAPSRVDPRNMSARIGDDGTLRLSREGGGELRLRQDQMLGQGMTSAVYGLGEGMPAVKVSRQDPLAAALDDLGYDGMLGTLPVPQIHKQYRLAPGSQLPGGEIGDGGLVSVVDRGPQSFAAEADRLQSAGRPLPPGHVAALQEALAPMNAKGFVLADLKPDNFGFRYADSAVAEMVPLDYGMWVKLRPDRIDDAAAMQRILLSPDKITRSMPTELAIRDIKDQLSLFDSAVDWKAMNGGRADGPLRTLGNSVGDSVPYTPKLGLMFPNLAPD